MASQSLYRKWRSQTFSDLIGQEAVVRTLLNAVRDGRMAHAYLFCGPRGTGKTSTARLLAKAINCANPHDGEPCNECISCREITEGRSPDVIEIDAASNTGVDNIRDLRESVNLMGGAGHHRLFIVDECFAYGELVTLADGSKMPIGKLVESKWQGEVLSYNVESGQVEPKRIVRHMKKVPAIPTVRVKFDNNRSIVCTINHKFYTPNGQVCAGHLQLGQFVYTDRERITKHQRRVVVGAAIGDGHIDLTGSAMRARLSINHGIAQKEYLDYKARLLGDLVHSSPRFYDGTGTYSKTGTYNATTLSRPEIAEIHRELYDVDGKKRLTQTYLDQIDELGLALWYLDDGSLVAQSHQHRRVNGEISIYSPTTRSLISMYSFSADEARLACEWLKERWAIESGMCVTAKGPVIWLTLAGTARLHNIIASHVPPRMEYKLLPEYRGHFQEVTDNGQVSGLAVSIVKSIEQVPAPEFVYNIEVADNHNYFVRDILVANCHMLTVSAFNALLKTLEEPPPRVVFVLATTEAHKVLPTIVSRCQRFDFRRHTMRNIVARLHQVAEGEGLALEPAAADLLARAAQGGMRDALSLLDQAMAYCGTEIDLDRTRAMLGLADPGALRRLIEYVAEQQSAEGLHLINELVTNGADLRQLNSQLAEEWRALVLARAGANVAEMMDYTDEDAREIAELASSFSLEELTACARVFTKNETPARGLPVPQLALELSFLECLTIRRNGGVSAAPVAQPARAVPANAPIAPRTDPRPDPRAALPPSIAERPAIPETSPNGVGARPASPADSQGPRPVQHVEELDLDAIERGEDPLPEVTRRAQPARPPARPTQPEPAYDDVPLPPEPEDDGEIAGAPVDELFADDEAPAPYASDAASDWLARARESWELVKQVCKQKSRSVAALLHSAHPVNVDDAEPPVLVLQADYQFHLEKLRDPKSRAAVEWAIEQVLEAPIKVRLVPPGSNDANGTNGSGGPGGSGGNGGPTPRRSTGGPGPAAPGGPSGGYSGDGGYNGYNGNSGKNGNGRPDASRQGPAAYAPAPDTGGNLRELGVAAAYANGQNGNGAAYSGKNGNGHGGVTGPAIADALPANVTPMRARTATAVSNGARPSRALEDEVRADAVIQAMLQSGVQLADVRPLDDEDGE